jgi:pimeloyl-ACP methyl ester carboxylesterase
MPIRRRLRRAPLPTPPGDAFAVQRARVRDELEIAYLREGRGGYPLLLLHGWPETKRIWWRNVEPLARAGFEVVVPDLRGYGDSEVSADDRHDIAEYGFDCDDLMRRVLGHRRYAVVGGDVGGVVAIDMALRFPNVVERLCYFNSGTPFLFEDFAAAGLDPASLPDDATADYRTWQGAAPDELAERLDTPERRRRYVASMYTHRLWATADAFTPEDLDFMTEPFADAAHMRASWAVYQLATGRRIPREMPRLLETVPTPTLLLYGPEDNVVASDFPERCEIAFTNRIGPVIVPDAGHFLQWERADVFNALLAACFRDLVITWAKPS